MKTDYQLGKDIGEIKAALKSLTKDGKGDCGCRKHGHGALPHSKLTEENRRVLLLLHENAERIKREIEQVIFDLGITQQNGERFYLARFTIDPQNTTSNFPMTPWGPYIAGCCQDGKYDFCTTIGCDPCAGH